MSARALRQRPPLVFVHGSAHAAWCWHEHFLDYFHTRGFRSYAIDLRGHGGAAGGEHLRWTTIDDYVTDLAAAVADVPEAPVLIGHSMGGLVVQKYLERRRARAAILLAPSPARGMLRSGARMLLRHPLILAHVALTLEAGHLYSTPARARALLFGPALSDARLADYVARFGRESVRALFDLVFDRPRVEDIRGKCPMLVMGAENDAILSRADITETARAYQAAWHMVPSIGHDMMLDVGWESVARHMADWIDDVALKTAL
jgi:pimeloyl-ACP methyl ester carboxylesterase